MLWYPEKGWGFITSIQLPLLHESSTPFPSSALFTNLVNSVSVYVHSYYLLSSVDVLVSSSLMGKIMVPI
jgi:hypothetical protein